MGASKHKAPESSSSSSTAAGGDDATALAKAKGVDLASQQRLHANLEQTFALGTSQLLTKTKGLGFQ